MSTLHRSRIGVVGASGGVGQAVARRLAPRADLRLGGRRLEPLQQVAKRIAGGASDTRFVDVFEPESLAAFCAGCNLIVDCSGPFSHVRDRVALSAFGAGVSYVGAAGDERLRGTLVNVHQRAGGTSVLCAGMLPGLSGLLPRVLAGDFDQCHALRAFIGVLDRFTTGAAIDFVAGLEGSESLAAWRDGRKESRALTRVNDLRLPFFSGRVTAHPYLNHEGERVARLLHLDSADWFNVFEGSHVLAAMTRLGHARVPLEQAADELARAADLDLAGRSRRQTFLMQMRGAKGGQVATRSLVVTSTDSNELTAAMTSLAAEAVLAGAIGPGCHYAAEVLDPLTAMSALHASAAISGMSFFEGSIEELGVVDDGTI